MGKKDRAEGQIHKRIMKATAIKWADVRNLKTIRFLHFSKVSLTGISLTYISGVMSPLY